MLLPRDPIFAISRGKLRPRERSLMVSVFFTRAAKRGA